jgi:hypothetical protein
MTWRRGRAPWTARGSVAGPFLAVLLAVAAIGAVDAAWGQAPSAEAPSSVGDEPPSGQDPPAAEPPPDCSNLEDDDGDGLTDLDDPDCAGPTDADESPASSPPAPAPTVPPPSSPPLPPPSPPGQGADAGTGGSAGAEGTTGQGGYSDGRGGTGGRKAGGHETSGKASTGRGGGTGPAGQGASGARGGRRDAGGEGRHASGGTPAAPEQRRAPEPSRGADDGLPGPADQSSGIAAFGTQLGATSFLSDGFTIPPFLLPLYRECGSRYGLRWQVLAAINKVETAFGTNLNVSTAGAIGWMQFMPSTWSAYGVDADGDGRRDPYDPHDAICAAARYLRAAGAPADIHAALFAYNHAEWYVELVLGLTRQFESLYLPEPLVRAKRLDRDFARKLVRIARRGGTGWALVLAILRVRGATERMPASPDQVRIVAERVARAQRRAGDGRLGPVVRSLFARRHVELKVAAAARYNRAVGLRGLVGGLHAVEGRLRRRVLESDRLLLYPGGREDAAAGRVDPRVLALLLYLAEKYDRVTITSLVSGHGYFARPGAPSMHVFGRAVDIAAIRGTPILGHQQPGGVTEGALRDILLLPDELQPSEVISLIDLGGPSFAASDHHDHIHIGF